MSLPVTLSKTDLAEATISQVSNYAGPLRRFYKSMPNIAITMSEDKAYTSPSVPMVQTESKRRIELDVSRRHDRDGLPSRQNCTLVPTAELADEIDVKTSSPSIVKSVSKDLTDEEKRNNVYGVPLMKEYYLFPKLILVTTKADVHWSADSNAQAKSKRFTDLDRSAASCDYADPRPMKHDTPMSKASTDPDVDGQNNIYLAPLTPNHKTVMNETQMTSASNAQTKSRVTFKRKRPSLWRQTKRLFKRMFCCA